MDKGYDAGIVVLTNDIDKTKSGYEPDKLSYMRLEAAAIEYQWMVKNNEKTVLIVSGGRIRPGPTLAEIIGKTALEIFHIPENDLYLEDKSLNTVENAIYSVDFLKKKDITSCLVVTNEFQLGRAMDCFDYYGRGSYINFQGHSAEEIILMKYPSKKEEIESFRRKKDTIRRAKHNFKHRLIFNIPLIGPVLMKYGVRVQMALLGQRPQEHVLDE